jgi:hypothetical protein
LLPEVGVNTSPRYRVFHSARILTDIRPVFGRDADVPPIGAVIAHVLKIDYFSQGDSGSLYVSLNNRDLELLRNLVDRAFTKLKTLRAVLESTGLPFDEAESGTDDEEREHYVDD